MRTRLSPSVLALIVELLDTHIPAIQAGYRREPDLADWNPGVAKSQNALDAWARRLSSKRRAAALAPAEMLEAAIAAMVCLSGQTRVTLQPSGGAFNVQKHMPADVAVAVAKIASLAQALDAECGSDVFRQIELWRDEDDRRLEEIMATKLADLLSQRQAARRAG